MTPRPPLASKPTYDLHAMTTTYSNAFRVSGSADELILDFGVDGHHWTDGEPEPIQLLRRLVLPWSNAPHLLVVLQQMLQQHAAKSGGNLGVNANRPT